MIEPRRTIPHLLRGIGLGVALSLGASQAALAATPATVSYIGCLFANGGAAVVAPDSDVALEFGWGTTTLSQAKAYRSAATVYVSQDGAPARVVNAFLAPVQLADGTWKVVWHYETGRVLASGDSTTVDATLYLSRKLWSGELDGKRHVTAGPGALWDPSLSCTVSAS